MVFVYYLFFTVIFNCFSWSLVNCCITVLEIVCVKAQNIWLTLKTLKVMESGSVWLVSYHFLLVVCSDRVTCLPLLTFYSPVVFCSCGEVQAWLSVCSEVQMICIWSSWCHCHPIISCFNTLQHCLPFWCQLTQDVLEKRPLNRVVVVVVFCSGVCVLRQGFTTLLYCTQTTMNGLGYAWKALERCFSADVTEKISWMTFCADRTVTFRDDNHPHQLFTRSHSVQSGHKPAKPGKVKRNGKNQGKP